MQEFALKIIKVLKKCNLLWILVNYCYHINVDWFFLILLSLKRIKPWDEWPDGVGKGNPANYRMKGRRKHREWAKLGQTVPFSYRWHPDQGTRLASEIKMAPCLQAHRHLVWHRLRDASSSLVPCPSSCPCSAPAYLVECKVCLLVSVLRDYYETVPNVADATILNRWPIDSGTCPSTSWIGENDRKMAGKTSWQQSRKGVMEN